MTQEFDNVQAVIWDAGVLNLLDQRLLPHETLYIDYTAVSAAAKAITDMVVRGAPAIGVTAAYAVALAVADHYGRDPANWRDGLEADLVMLADARPTAINLIWAVERMRRFVAGLEGDPRAAVEAEAIAIHDEDIAACHQLGELGADLIESPCAVLTHCNAGALATGGYGTALGVIRSAFKRGLIKHVYADETRPWMQGARLTAWEMVQDNIPVSLLADGASAHLMKQGDVGWVIVGSDRIAANGDVCNKIGTYQAAIAARYHGLKFMVAAPTSTIDMNAPDGDAIPIESRTKDELLMFGGKRVAADGADAWNPVFDVTPASLVDAIVTEKGVVLEPTAEKIAALMAK